MSEINGNAFSGANNVNESFYSKKGILSPRVILNADVDLAGNLLIRKGKNIFISKAGAHSLWADKHSACMLFAANGTLYRNAQGAAASVGTVTGPRYPLSYEYAENKVYISNPYWQGVFDPANNTVSSWGVALPPGPMLLSGNGNLPAGTYYVCMTNVSGSEISGNGSISSITLDAGGGIQVLNRPTGALMWMTDTEEGIFYLVGAVNTIVDIPTVEPLPSFLCSPPPFMENLCYAHGRMWGSVGPNVFYSQEYNLGLFKLAANIFPFEDTVTMIAKVPTGLFIGMKNRTRFLSGTIPRQMAVRNAGAGSVKGSLTYCNNFPELASILGTAEKDFTDVPVWLTSEGVEVGNMNGELANLTKNKLKMGIPENAASLYRNLEGVIQFLVSFKRGSSGSGAGFIDADTISAFKNGQLDIHNKSVEGLGSITRFGDDVTCTVTRGGVIVPI